MVSVMLTLLPRGVSLIFHFYSVIMAATYSVLINTVIKVIYMYTSMYYVVYCCNRYTVYLTSLRPPHIQHHTHVQDQSAVGRSTTNSHSPNTGVPPRKAGVRGEAREKGQGSSREMEDERGDTEWDN